MPVIRHPDDLPARSGEGWTERAWAGPEVFGAPVPMRATRVQVTEGAASREIPLGAQEALVYVITGSGTAESGPAGPGTEGFSLGRESVLWLAGAASVRLLAGTGGLDVLVAESAGPAREAVPPLLKVFSAADLPHLVSTRDTRDRLDLVTENVPVGARQIRADRILYHPGDTAAAHYHTDCHHVFCVLAGSGIMHAGPQAGRLEAGMSALVNPGEVHWFENDTGQEFSFVEFWAPPPADTIWTVEGDRCTWAPGR